MALARAFRVIFLAMLLASGCGRQVTTPTAPTPPGPMLSDALPPPALELTGTVTDDEGTPVAGARVLIAGSDWDLAEARTDSAGRYTMALHGVRPSMHYPGLDPPGTEDAVGFLRINASGFDWYSRWILGSGQHLVENVRLRHPKRIKSGESERLAIRPDDTVCDPSVWPGRELICRYVHAVASRDGIMTVEASPTQTGWPRPNIEVFDDETGSRGNPTEIRITAGVEYTVWVAFPWGFDGTFDLKTSVR